jgi:hypothetical protein
VAAGIALLNLLVGLLTAARIKPAPEILAEAAAVA